ncbi:MAG: MmcQ/YjbR family DNA-binding protein [Sediminibacterium sp.]
MHIEDLRNYVLSLPDVEETTPFGPDTLVYKINGKIFFLVGLDNEIVQFNVKCDPDLAIELREQYPQSVLPGYHMNKKHWSTIVVDGVLSTRQLKEFINHSYQLVGKRKK